VSLTSPLTPIFHCRFKEYSYFEEREGKAEQAASEMDVASSIHYFWGYTVSREGRRRASNYAITVSLHILPNFTLRVAKCKGKEVQLQAWTDPEGSRSLRLPDFKTVGT